MPTTGLIEINSGRMALTTSTTEISDLFGNSPSPFNPRSLPFAGTVKKIIVNSLDTGVGPGFFWLEHAVGSLSPYIQLDELVLAAGSGIQEFVVDYPFAANDGFAFSIGGNDTAFSVTLEIEYSLV